MMMIVIIVPSSKAVNHGACGADKLDKGKARGCLLEYINHLHANIMGCIHQTMCACRLN